MRDATHIVGYQDGTSFTYGGVMSVTYTQTAIILCGGYMVVSLDPAQVSLIQVLPSTHLSVQQYSNGWSHDPHARRFE